MGYVWACSQTSPGLGLGAIGGGAIFFLGGSSSGETKIAEGIRNAKNRRFVLYIAFSGKSGGLQPPAPWFRRPWVLRGRLKNMESSVYIRTLCVDSEVNFFKTMSHQVTLGSG